jgi:hypothetical protein
MHSLTSPASGWRAIPLTGKPKSSPQGEDFKGLLNSKTNSIADKSFNDR